MNTPQFQNALKILNVQQTKAMAHNPSTPLQVLAGPGTGKTQVLACRIAYLVENHPIPPSQICAMTFTKQATKEMHHRLAGFMGHTVARQLQVGTIHGFCANLLRHNGPIIGLSPNFTICSETQGRAIIRNILKSGAGLPFVVEGKLPVGLTRQLISQISRIKASGQIPEESAAGIHYWQGPEDKSPNILSFNDVCKRYAATLKANNSLDFDDLISRALECVQKSPSVLPGISHVFVDEFQDTSHLQYQLVKNLKKQCGITVVGDPDQTIHGWNGADPMIFERMAQDFPGTQVITLEDNYRSTSPILDLAAAIVSQDKARTRRRLFSSLGEGPKPTYATFRDEHQEADAISAEIKRLVDSGLHELNDIGILVRTHALSRPIEASLQKHSIPVRMHAGRQFFDRAEIQDLLAYLRLADNPFHDSSFLRAVNVPGRSIGSKSVETIQSFAQRDGISCMAFAEAISRERTFGMAPKNAARLQSKLSPFVTVIGYLQRLAQEGTPVADIIKNLLDKIEYEAYLEATYSDNDAKWENVLELMSYAVDFDRDAGLSDMDVLLEDSEAPLQRFLQASALTAEPDTSTSANEPKVTVSTCHASKGLEWPVVFVPAVEDKIFPVHFKANINEERRVLYVACTRAQSRLYLTNASSRMRLGRRRSQEPSTFITDTIETNADLFSYGFPPSSLHEHEGMIKRSASDESAEL